MGMCICEIDTFFFQNATLLTPFKEGKGKVDFAEKVEGGRRDTKGGKNNHPSKWE